MDLVERLFLELVTLELRKGAGLADAGRQAKFVMEQDMPEFLDSLDAVKTASAPKPAKSKKGKKDVPPEEVVDTGLEVDEIDIDSSLEPTAE